MTRATIQQMQNVKAVNEAEIAGKTTMDSKAKHMGLTSAALPPSTSAKEAAKQPPGSKKKKGKKKK